MTRYVLPTIRRATLALLLVTLVQLAFAQDPEPLAAGADTFLGNVMTARFDPAFATYWNQVTPEDAGKWLSVEAQRDTMVWTVLDLIFQVAESHGIPVKQHTFVWGSQEPRWIAGLPHDEQRAEVEQWMRLFAERYPDVAMIDVVNEPLHAPPSYAEALGGAGDTGWEWVIWSFEQARELFPDSTLLINEYNILCCAGERARYLGIVELLLERGLIDGIGVQAHGLERADPAAVRTGLDELAATGLPIYVSELELEASDDQVQLEMYQRIFPVLWEHPAVAGVTLWGYRAGQIWKQNAYLVDWFEEERPVLQWLRTYLEGAPPYQDSARPTAERVADLLSRMTLDEKIGQMTQINLTRLMAGGEWDRGPLDEAWLQRTLVDANVGSLLSGGGAAPVPNEPQAWAHTVNELQRYAIENTRLGIPILYGVDAVHGHNNVLGATIYPHQIGLAASFDPALVAEVAEATARDVAATGIHWNFAPVADLGRDPRWGRFYETFGESPAVASAFVAAHVDGQQRVPRVAATVKHYVGYGQAESGLDRAPADLSLRELRQAHLPPFVAAIDAGVRTVMVNSGSVNGVPVHASRWLLTDVLRGELGFAGVVLSDWADIDKLLGVHRVATTREEAVAMAVNAGVDVVMVPHDAAGFTAVLAAQVEAGVVSEARIDEAAGRVLTLKFELGLFEEPYVDVADAAQIVQTDRALARRAALAGMTLLENRRGALPLTDPLRIVVTGPGATSVPMQMGGWTIQWQGLASGAETPPAVTVLEALRGTAPAGTDVAWYELGTPEVVDAVRDADAVVLVVGEPPYAEGAGDAAEPRLPAGQEAAVAGWLASLDGADPRLVTVLFAGRPVMLPESLYRASDALLMAYLAGTEAGSAVADVLYGRASPAGRLPFTWPASVGQIPIAADALPAEAQQEPRYPMGDGISYASFRYRGVAAEVTEAGVVLDVEVESAADIASDHVLLAWVSYPVGPVMRPVRELVGFARASFAAGETRTVRIEVPFAALAVVPGDVPGDAERILAAGTYRFEVGRQRVAVELPEQPVPW